jgi:hypothetical protein
LFCSIAVSYRNHQARQFLLWLREILVGLHPLRALLTELLQIACTCVYIAAIVLAATDADAYVLCFSLPHTHQLAANSDGQSNEPWKIAEFMIVVA